VSPHAEVTGDLQEMRARNEVHRAQREHLRDMDLDDQDVSVLRAYSFFLLHHDAFDEALDVHRRTLELDPASPLSTKITAEMFYAWLSIARPSGSLPATSSANEGLLNGRVFVAYRVH